MDSEKKIYENAPLAETVFEIRFPNEPAVECGRDKFYDKIRDAYSMILVPRSVEGRAMAFETYKFERADGTYGAMLSINKFAIYCKKYEGFDLFRKETMRMVDIFKNLYKVKMLARVGLRYINFIPFTREEGIIPLQNYLNIKIGLPKAISTDFTNLSLIFVSKTDGGSITTRIEPAISLDGSHEVIILDFDYAKEKDLSFDSISKYLNESHQHTKYLFEELITDGYKKVIRGEVV